MGAFSFTTGQSLLLALLVFSAVAVALQMALALGHRLFQVRQRMFRARIVDAYTDPIIELLTGEVDEAGRSAFVAALPTVAAQRAVVVEMLLSSVAKVRGEAQATVARVMEEAGFTAYYLRRLGSHRARERAIAAEVLGEMRAVSALDALLATLRDRSPVVTVVAARALGKLSQPEAVRALMDEYARGRLPSGIVASSLLGMGPAGGPALQALLHADDATVRALAASLIGLLDWTPAGDDLLALLRDEEATVRARAAESLGRLGTETATAPLLALLRDVEREPRVATAEALGQLGDPAAAEGLAAALADEQHDVRLAAATALGTLGAAGLRALSRATRGGDLQARAYAVEVLQRAGRDELIGAESSDEVTPEPLPTLAEPLPTVAVARTDTRVPTPLAGHWAKDLTPQLPLPRGEGELERARATSATDAAVKPPRRKRPKRPPTDGAVRSRPNAPADADLLLPPASALEIGLLTLPGTTTPDVTPHPMPRM